MNALPNFVNGEIRPVSGVEVDPVLNPTTEGTIAMVPRASAGMAELAVQAAHVARTTWRRTTPAERSARLLAVAEILLSNISELASIETDNVGMPTLQARASVTAAADALRFYAGASRLMGGVAAAEYVQGMTSFVRREPVGVVAQFVPWNVPLLMAVWKMAPALAAGNTVVMKPSQRTPISLLRLCELLQSVLPPGVLNVITGTHDEVGTSLLEHPLVRMVSLTGSTAGGAHVATRASASVKRLHLELGGKTPVIVCTDADIGAAAAAIARGATDNAGQDCTAASRVIAVDPVHDNLVERLVAELRALKIGDPRLESTDVGPLVGNDRRVAVLQAVETAVRDGGIVAYGGRPLEGPGFFMEPALLTDVHPDSDIAREEIFGPVITVERASSPTEAVALANRSEFGLAAGVWTESVRTALAISEALDVGKIWINDHHKDATELPHGGRKRSGYGSDLSAYSLQDYTALKSVHSVFNEVPIK